MTCTNIATRGASSSEGKTRRRLGWASWFAGADCRVLALVPSEQSFLEAQGLVIVAMACVTGFAVAVAGSGWWNVPITHILWLGVVWTAVICIVDRLIYKSFGTSRRANLMLAVPRALLSLMLALVLGLPMVQFIFKPSISNQLTQTSAVAQKDARKGRNRLLRAEDPPGERADRRDPGPTRRHSRTASASSRGSPAANATSRRARTRTAPGAATGAGTTRSRRASPAGDPRPGPRPPTGRRSRR